MSHHVKSTLAKSSILDRGSKNGFIAIRATLVRQAVYE